MLLGIVLFGIGGLSFDLQRIERKLSEIEDWAKELSALEEIRNLLHGISSDAHDIANEREVRWGKKAGD